MVRWIKKCVLLFVSILSAELLLTAAMGDFWRNREQWLPTWPQNVNDRAMVVYVFQYFRVIHAAYRRTATP